MSTEQKKDPVHKIYVRGVRLAIWANKTRDEDVFYGFTLQRAYKDKDGKKQYTDSFPISMAQDVRKAIDLADTWDNERQQEEFADDEG